MSYTPFLLKYCSGMKGNTFHKRQQKAWVNMTKVAMIFIYVKDHARKWVAPTIDLSISHILNILEIGYLIY